MEPNQQHKQGSKILSRTRDIEIKNKLTMTGGEGGITGKQGEGLSRNMYKGPMDKLKWGRIEDGRWRWK